jgi:hypothetical protein
VFCLRPGYPRGFLGQLDRVGGRQDQGSPVLLEYDQADPVAALVGVREQGKDGALGGRHPFGHRHRPGSVHHEQHQVGGFLYPNLALEVNRANGEGHRRLRCSFAVRLEWGRGAQGGIKGQVIGASLTPGET